jgi:ssDNA-binding replication factor A large subunit
MAERLERELEQGKVYYFSDGKVAPANRKYSTVDNDYKINFNEDRSTVKVADVQVRHTTA